MKPFISDISKIRDRARARIDDGAVTAGYKADREQVIKVLNEVLATEIVCMLRYKRHYFTVDAIFSDSIRAEFLEHAIEEQQHADMVAARIVQLNGAPDFEPKNLATRSHAQYAEGDDADDPRGSGGGADRDRDLYGDRALAGRRRSDDAAPDRADPGEGGGACRRPRDAPRQAPGGAEEARSPAAAEIGLTIQPVPGGTPGGAGAESSFIGRTYHPVAVALMLAAISRPRFRALGLADVFAHMGRNLLRQLGSA